MLLKVVYTIHERLPDGSYGSSSTHIARSFSGVSRPAAEHGSSSQGSDTATTFLKSCLALICYTRPDLIPDAHTDYSVSVLDIVESAAGNGRIFEGQGMMGWILAEQNAGNTCIAGKLQKAPSPQRDIHETCSALAEDILEVVLELKPRKPIPRKDFLTTLASSSKPLTPPQPAESTPTSQTMTLPNGSTVDSATMFAMLQTLFTATANSAPANAGNRLPEAGIDSPESQARQIVNTLGASMPLLPGINLFNPPQAKASQQQRTSAQNNSAPAQAIPFARLRPKAKPSASNLPSSHGSTSSAGHVMSDGNADMGGFTFPNKGGRASSTARGQPQTTSSRSKVASSSAHPASEPVHHNNTMYPQQSVRLKYWAQGCLKCRKTESVGWRVKQTRKKALDGTVLEPGMLPEDDKVCKLCEECAQKLPSHKNKKKRKANTSIDGNITLDSLPMHGPDNPAYRASLPHTSPLRRSPRRHFSSSLNPSSLLSSQPLTSPTGLGSRDSSLGPPGKRRKFTSALSAAALREENKTAEGMTPNEGSLLAHIPSFKHQLNGRDATFELGDDNSNQLQAKEIFGGNAGSSSTSTLTKPPMHDGPINHEDESFNFFLNASPGTIMRSFNIISPRKNATPTNDLSSAGTLKAFPNIGLSPLQSKRLARDSQGTSAVFSPLGSSLSTPFRALLNPPSQGRERATSEQPPASHSRLMEELELRDANSHTQQQILQVPQKNAGPGNGITQFLSSDDNLLGSASNVQINLLPATADKRQGGKDASTNDQLLSDSIMADFDAFLLDSSNGLFSPTPFLARPDGTGKPALAPLSLPYDVVKQQSLSPLAILSSEMDFDLSNLPPSSPPPLPGSTTSTHHLSSNSLANVQDFWSNFNSGLSSNGNYLASNKNGMNMGHLDDGQSPISVGTTVTQGGTPQDMPISHDTGPSEPGRAAQDERSVSGHNATPVVRPVTTRTVTMSTESPVSFAEIESVQDPLFEYFSFVEDVRNGSAHDYASHQRQSSASSVSSAFLERLKKSTNTLPNNGVTRSSSSNMTMSWSDSTASTSSSIASLPVTDLTARSKMLQKQKALEEAKRTNVPIDSAVLENTIDALFDLSD